MTAYLKWGAQLALLATVGCLQVITAPTATAALFQKEELNQEEVIAIAAPVGTTSHKLLILEQLSSERQCWQEQGATVDPLLVNFDFTGICNRATDSNGYSVRVADEDLGVHYSLRLASANDTLRLLASSNRMLNAPAIEIGRATRVAGEFVRITLNPGWRITKRSYNGQILGHYYLTNDESLSALLPSPSPPRTPTPTPGPSPIPVTPSPTPIPTTPIPTRPIPVPLPTPSPVPPVTPSPVPPVTPAPPATPAPLPVLVTRYRVTVPAPTLATQDRIRELVPDSFRTVINGQLVMQVGLFRDRQAAVDLQNRLRRNNFPAVIDVVRSFQTPSPSPSPVPSPTPTPRPPVTPTPVPPAARRTIVIDPGHGGRDPGAVGRGNLFEKTVVFDISQQVARLLEAQGMRVVMTRTRDVTLELEPRVQIAERFDADLFVSIHANAISLSRPEVNGAETYYYQSAQGFRLAQRIQRNLVQDLGMNDRGVREARFFVIRRTSMPAALVEVGFVTGRVDAPRLSSPAFRRDAAEAIADGILSYIRSN